MKRNSTRESQVSLVRSLKLTQHISKGQLEDYIQLAINFCDIPLAYISIFDETKIHVIARKGQDLGFVPWQESFCRITSETKATVIIEDARMDHRTRTFNAVKGHPSIVFYAGFPLFNHKNEVIGAFCIMDHEARKLKKSQIHSMQLLSRQVNRCLQDEIDLLHHISHDNSKSDGSVHPSSEANIDVEQELEATKKKLSHMETLLLKQELKQDGFELLMDALPICVTFIDKEYRFQYLNKTYEKWFYTSSAEMMGQHISKSITQELFKAHQPLYDKALAGEYIQFEGVFPFGPITRTLRISYIPARDNNQIVQGIYITCEDISQLKDYQKQLEQSNESLMTHAYIASEDIQSPLKTIRRFAEFLEKDLNQKDIDYKKEYLDFIIDSTNQLDNLTSDLLEYSKLDHIRYKRSKAISLGDIIEFAKSNIQKEIIKSDAVIQSNIDDVKILGNRNELTLLFQHLLSNAITYQEKGNQPIIGISTEMESEHFCRIIIRDNGIGIAPEHHETIFNPLQRIHAYHQYKGSGIGLAICKKIIDKYDSRFEIQSDIGKGTTLSFLLPKQ